MDFECLSETVSILLLHDFQKIANICVSTYLLTKMAITARLTQHILLGASASCRPTPVDHTNRWQGFLDFVLLTGTRLSSSPTFADPHIKYPSRRSFILQTNDMAEPVQPLDLNRLNIYVVEELIQLIVGSYAEIIVNSQRTEVIA